MEKWVYLLFFLCYCHFINAQRITPIDDDGNRPVPFICNPSNGNFCNLILNNNFTTNCIDPNNTSENNFMPFSICVNNWTNSHGTPQLNINLPLVAPNTNHASMWSNVYLDGGEIKINGEGIAIGIPKLITNSTYTYSMFKRIFVPNINGRNFLDEYIVVLIKCADFSSIRTYGNSYSIPSIPTTAQIIINEVNATNTSWQPISQTFVANDEYDVIWIFPKNYSNPNYFLSESWLEVGLPVLKKLNTCNPIPAITSSSYFEYYGCVPASPANSPIIPDSYNSFCFYWECSGQVHLFSNYISNNEWYVDDVLVPGYDGQELTTNDPNIFALNNPKGLHKFQLRNLSSGFSQMTTPTYVYFASSWSEIESGGSYKEDYTINLNLSFLNHGPNALYSWNIPGCVVTDLNQNDPNIQVYFPANVPTNQIVGTLTITNSFCNMIVNVIFSYNGNLKPGINSINNVRTKNSVIYPNPATNAISINSLEKIKAVEIRDIFGIIQKRISFNHQKEVRIDIHTFKKGLYNCLIYTEDGLMENLKLIIEK